MSFKDLNISIRYRTDMHNFPRDFLVPVLSKTVTYKRGVGYFSTSSLVHLTEGLCELAANGGKVQLVCSPNLSQEDIRAIELGYKTREEAFCEKLIDSITEPIDYFEEERLNLAATLIANGNMDIKIAFIEDENGFNLYHEKLAIFIDAEGNRIGYAGSLNESDGGFQTNFESFYTFCSWKDQSQQEGVALAEGDFDTMWNDRTEKLRIVPFPQIVVEKLMEYKKDKVDYSIDERQFGYKQYLKQQQKFRIPDDVKLHEYQEEAVKNWFSQDFKGIFNMSTGSGKTYTALACMVKLAMKLNEKLAVFIVCPYIHLVSQWEEDVILWGTNPIIAHSKSPDKGWEEHLRRAYLRFKKDEKPFICITTKDTFFDDKIQQYITRFNEEQNVLLIADEAHNLGSERSAKILPFNVRYRIALSATIKRHMDKTGTKKLYDYFGEECIEYGLEQAIKDGNLVHYDYFPIPVYLTAEELEKYERLTKKLRKYLIEKNGKVQISEAGKSVIYERTRVLAGAINKVNLLMELMEPYKEDNNMLVYCGATSVEDEDTGQQERQIDLITNKLQKDFGMSVERFTAEEDLKTRQNIKKYFSQGMYQVITAIKCLDEGVNIPGIKAAFIMSSSRNPKEFIQRRGRLLRKSPGKKKAVIYDFITLPRDLDNVRYEDFEKDKTIIIGEMARIEEFGRLADNPEVSDLLMNQIMTAYETFLEIEDEMERMEEYYGE